MTQSPARERIRQLALLSPDLNQNEVARVAGVSRQRVSQIVRRDGLTFAKKWQHRLPPHPCVFCGLPKTESIDHSRCFLQRHYVTLTCKRCGREFQRLASQSRRAENGPRYDGSRGPFCSKSECPALVTFPCRNCQQPVNLDEGQRWRLKVGRQQSVFCAGCKHLRLAYARAIRGYRDGFRPPKAVSA